MFEQNYIHKVRVSSKFNTVFFFVIFQQFGGDSNTESSSSSQRSEDGINNLESTTTTYKIQQKFQIVNVIFKTRLCNTKLPLDLAYLSSRIFPTNSKLYRGRPTQLKICMPDENVVCLIFGRGAIRLMGKGLADEAEADIMTA